MKSPNLSPSCPGWQEDLPGPDELPVMAPALGFDTPNHQDDIFLELPRASAFIRGLVIWFVPLMSVLFFVLSWLVITIEHAINLEAWAIVGSATLVIVWSILFCIKFDLSAPRDLPLRFNRSRSRIYAYNFNYRWWNPFERWRVEPVAYDWSQVRAERWLKRGATAQGGLVIKGGVVLSIVKPGTNEVIDRFPLTTMGADEHAWAYICTYMQQGPDALPPPGPPKDHNDVSWFNIALLLAPKVKWPADMDLESRTAP
ncbi:DUF6708 domain-containing protein [Pseudomonas putida]|uniref:DUF6708 domain-containing protein n=1 Tax=Pseudomonas putida TaxID=303 RepID=UPI001F0B430B|nr:DUF6708 domain-containing protein [Pseudomonas putida]